MLTANMKKLISWLVLVFAAVVMFGLFWLWKERSFNSQTKYYSVLEKLEKDGFDNLKMQNLAGESVELHSTEAEIIIINFWASWCGPCVNEYPSFLKMLEHFNGRVKIIAISLDEERGDLDNFLNIYGYGNKETMLHLYDPKKESTAPFGTNKLPETYIFNAQRKLIRKVPGEENWASESVLSFLERLMDEQQKKKQSPH